MVEKVLLVEDEIAIRKFTKINVEKAGFQVLEAGTGEDGVRIALEENPHVVILDVMLPGMNGFEVCDILRNEMPNVGIIMLTAKTQDVDRILGLEKGADDYMVKPFNPQELVLRIQSLVRRIKLTNDDDKK
ncbi:MAG: response regulator, partial [Helcococcus sp.]|nr:response regulator [Helcococcus sp.]